MKKMFEGMVIPMALALGLNSGVSFAQSKNDVALPGAQVNAPQIEKFVEDTFISAKWGNGNGEFGYFQQPKDKFYPDMGPNAIGVDKNENIYILDAVNRRINVFAKDGKYKTSVPLSSLGKYKIFDPANNELYIDSSGYIYIRTQFLDFPFPNSAVVKLGPDGELLHQYIPTAELHEHFSPKTPQFEKFLKRIVKQTKVTVLSKNVGKLSRLHLDSNRHVRGIAGDSMAIDFADNKISPVAIAGAPAESIESSYGIERQASSGEATVRKLVFRNKGTEEISILDLSEIIRRLPSGASVQNFRYIGSDNGNNVYFLVLADGILNGNSPVIKYSKALNGLVGIANVQNISEHPVAIGPSGNIYQLIWDSENISDGVRILRWEAQK